MPHAPALAYLTDVEGHWEKLVDFATDNPLVSLDAHDRIVVADDARFVFGGDSVDRGPAGRRVVEALIDAKQRHPDRVFLIAGNRDINKLRLHRELSGHPPSRAPAALPRPELLRWIFAHTMGAADAFAMRQRELVKTAQPAGDEDVVASFVADVAPDGAMWRYLELAELALALDDTLIVHGGISDQSLGHVPGSDVHHADALAWIDALNAWYRAQLAAFRRDPMSQTAWQPLITYQAPVAGTNDNPASVVYRRMLDDSQRPMLPSCTARATLAKAGIRRLLVGHTPMGDVPTIVRTGRDDAAPFEMVMADNSYSRRERGSVVRCEPRGALAVRGRARLDDGTDVDVHGTLEREDDVSPLGKHDAATGEIVKGSLPDGRWHLFRHIANRQVEQRAISNEELAARRVVPA